MFRCVGVIVFFNVIETFFSFPHGVRNGSIVLQTKKIEYKLPRRHSQSKTAILNLTPLPDGISPFEKSQSKVIDVQGNFRSIAKPAIEAAIRDGVNLIELEFPPLIGGEKSKSQFDDFDNIQELDRNKEWSVLLAQRFLENPGYDKGNVWLVFPDLKECELAKQEWVGKQFRKLTFTTIESIIKFVAGEKNYVSPWGASMVSNLSRMFGGESGDAGFMGDLSAQDQLVRGENFPPNLVFFVQPGNGGPVEDWINCELFFDAIPDTTMNLVVVNGALDKIKGGYYPGVFFPKLAATVDRFYKKFESVFYLKPISDKGVYGWLYRLYPEPWQVVLQRGNLGKGFTEIENKVVYTSNERPTYEHAVNALLAAANINVR